MGKMISSQQKGVRGEVKRPLEESQQATSGIQPIVLEEVGGEGGYSDTKSSKDYSGHIYGVLH